MTDVLIQVGQSNTATVVPPCEEIIQPLMSYQQPTVVLKREGYGVSTAARSYYVSENGRAHIPVGFVPVVSKRLNEAGYTVRIRDLRRWSDPEMQIAESLRDSAESLIPGVFGALRDNPVGVLEIPKGPRRTDAMALICRLFGLAQVMIVCASTAQAQQVRKEISGSVGRAVATIEGKVWESRAPITIATRRAFLFAGWSDWPVLIFADADDSLTSDIVLARQLWDRNRVYALADPVGDRSQRRIVELQNLAGSTIYRDPELQRATTDELSVAVAFAPVRIERQQVETDPRRHREQLWLSTARNGYIRDVASAISSADHDRIQSLGLPASSISEFSSLVNVVIVVDSPAHAKVLERLLSDWATSPARGNRSIAPVRREIVTSDRVERYAADGDCVLLAASGGSGIAIPSGVRRRNGKTLIIDFDDAGNRRQASDTASRAAAYEHHGLDVIASPHMAAAAMQSNPPAHRQGRRRNHRNTSRRR